MDGQTIDGGTAELTVTKPDPFADVQITYVNKNGKAYRAESYKAYPNGTLKLVSTNSL
ncbi:hypothetical protein [Anaerotignum sp.]|uniref:hypothetical protein n=1 Tax=Anaerotignum sp. TaxID=2039241 RepID=UPI00289649DE|nr:hypothetical protein [Anaerotignum sp.]